MTDQPLFTIALLIIVAVQAINLYLNYRHYTENRRASGMLFNMMGQNFRDLRQRLGHIKTRLRDEEKDDQRAKARTRRERQKGEK